VEYARAKGVVVVAAAGNDGRGRVGYPARYPGVLAVAATQFDETTTFYSNWGKEIDLAAPGGNVRVDQDRDGKPDGVLQNTVVPGQTSRADYLWFMGTSMASPHVAGVAALLVGAGVTKPVAVESILLGTARKPKGKPATGDPARGEVRLDDRYGAGIVDAGAALRKARLGRGAGGLGLGASLALLGAGMLRRRRLSTIRLGLGFVGPLVFGAAGFFELAAWVLGPGAFGNPLLASAGLPFLAIALGFGMVRLRPGLAGFTFGLAGALLFAALTLATGVRLVPDLMDRAWLIVHAVTATLLATLVLRRGSRAGPSASP
jgi:serine protease